MHNNYLSTFVPTTKTRTMKKTLSIIAAALLSTASFAQNTVWNSDQGHSSVAFAVDHMVISETTGQFGEYAVVAKADKDDFSDAQFEVTIQMNSIDTRDEKRDGHLKNGDFFDVEKFPTMTFKSTKMKKGKGKNYKLHGDLTLKGVTKAVVFDAKFGGIITDPWGNTRAGIKITGEIDRQDYGVTYNSVMDSGGLAVGNEVRIETSLELIKQK